MTFKQKRGTELCATDQRHVLRSYVHRFTADHTPQWARKLGPNGEPSPVQFSSDQDWLENTFFRVRKDGRLDSRARSCESHPTWPNNPELR